MFNTNSIRVADIATTFLSIFIWDEEFIKALFNIHSEIKMNMVFGF